MSKVIRALPVTGSAATNVLTLSGNAVAAETVTVGGKTYTFTSPLTNSANNVLVGATASDSLDNLIAAINAAAGAGTLYGTGTTANTQVTAAAAAGDTMLVTSVNTGTYYDSGGEAITCSETMTNGSWFGTTLLLGSTSASAPTAATHGMALPGVVDRAAVLVRSTRGSGALTANLRVWGYNNVAAEWFSLGLLNSGSNIAETDTDLIRYAEEIVGLRAFTRVAIEIESLGGTDTAVKVYLACTPSSSASQG